MAKTKFQEKKEKEKEMVISLYLGIKKNSLKKDSEIIRDIETEMCETAMSYQTIYNIIKTYKKCVMKNQM